MWSGHRAATLLLTVLLLSSTAFAATELSAPERASLTFNQWYINQLIANKSPLTDFKPLSKYVTAETVTALKRLYRGDNSDKDLPDADMFIKAQDYDDDWAQVSVLMSDFDPVCTNVYVAFGKEKKHVVADCMVEDAGKWKVRSVALVSDLP